MARTSGKFIRRYFLVKSQGIRLQPITAGSGSGRLIIANSYSGYIIPSSR